VPIKVFGRLAEQASAWKPGSVLSVSGRLGGRDWQGKVYGDIVANTVEVVSEGTKDAAGPMMASPRTTPMKSRFERSAVLVPEFLGHAYQGVCQHLSPYPLFGQTWCFFTGGTMYVNNLLQPPMRCRERMGFHPGPATRRRKKISQNDPPPDPPLVRGGAWRSVTLGDGKSRHDTSSRRGISLPATWHSGGRRFDPVQLHNFFFFLLVT